jgi:hypothetical protein
MNTNARTINVTKAEEESWTISVECDTDDLRVLRQVFSDAVYAKGFTGIIKWNAKSGKNTLEAANFLYHGIKSVDHVTEDMYARQQRLIAETLD